MSNEVWESGKADKGGQGGRKGSKHDICVDPCGRWTLHGIRQQQINVGGTKRRAEAECKCISDFVAPRDQLYEIGLPGKLILGDYFQENRTSRRPFLLPRISFSGRPIFIQLVQGVGLSNVTTEIEDDMTPS